MKNLLFIRRVFYMLMFLVVSTSCSNSKKQTATSEDVISKPTNILFIVADDMGYTDFTPFGGEIPTPNLQKLSDNAIRYSNFYTAPTCSPARAMLITGVDNHLTGIGAMKEVRDNVFKRTNPEIMTRKGYEGYLNNTVITLPQILKQNGYHTYVTGKWHLGLQKQSWPVNKGFDKSFCLLQGGSTHFGKLKAMHQAPKKAQLVENDDFYTPEDDFYTTKGFTDKMLSYLKDHDKKQPFFAYLAYTAPHDPLQCPPEYYEKFAGKYKQGYDFWRNKRLENLTQQGFLPKDVKLARKVAQKWEDLPKQKQEELAKTYEVYAGMVNSMDEHIGRVIKYLKDENLFDNTLIVFLSDNGSSSFFIKDYARGYKDKKPFNDYHKENFDNSLKSIGTPFSAVAHGPGWAQVGMIPFHMFKNTTAEGGIRTPTIIKWPKGYFDSENGKINQSTIGHVQDLAPTTLDLINLSFDHSNGNFHKFTGQSLLPYLNEKKTQDYAVAWELHGNRAVRKGDWKILWNFNDQDKKWELYNLKNDPGETTDVSLNHSKILADLENDWKSYVIENNILVMD